MSVIDEVKQKTDIVDLVSQYATLTKSGQNFRALCPFHSEKRPSFFVYPEQQSWHCFGACSTGGDVFSFIMKKENMDFGEALRFLADKAGVTIPSRIERDEGKEEKEKLYQVNDAASQYFHNLLINSDAGEKARNYLDKRGLSSQTISDFQLGYSLDSWEALKQHLNEKGFGDDDLLKAGLVSKSDEGKVYDRFRDRLMFTIKDARGRTTGFGARALDDSMPKYLNSPQTPVFDKSGILYGLNLAMPSIRQQNTAVVVEGYMDVITAHQNGFNNVVASMGTAITDKQVNQIRRQNIVLAMDADTAGEEAMLRCVDYENKLNSEIKVVTLPEEKDPDDVIRESAQTWKQLLEKAVPVVDYTIDMVTAELNLDSARDKELVVRRLAPIIGEIESPVRLAHYIQKLARKAGVPEHTIEVVVSKPKPARRARESINESAGIDVKSISSNPVEEDCLALILRYPELKKSGQSPLPEYFADTRNREIFNAWQQADDVSLLKESIDSALWEQLDYLLGKSILATGLEQRYNKYIRRLKEEYYRDKERKRAVVFAQEAESGGSGADLAKLKEEGIDPSVQLGEVFTQRVRKKQK